MGPCPRTPCGHGRGHAGSDERYKKNGAGRWGEGRAGGRAGGLERGVGRALAWRRPSMRQPATVRGQEAAGAESGMGAPGQLRRERKVTVE